MKKHTKVKIFLASGISIEGTVRKWNDKKIVLNTIGGDGKFHIYHPKTNILMVRTFDETSDRQLKENRNKSIKQTTQSTTNIKIGQVWCFPSNNSEWVVSDIQNDWICVENLVNGDILTPTVIELNRDWQLISNSIQAPPQYASNESVEEEPEEDPFVLRAKKLSELRLLKTEQERQTVAHKIRSFTPNSNNRPVSYGIPDFTKQSTPDNSSKKINGSDGGGV